MSANTPIRAIFMGTPWVSLPTLQSLIDAPDVEVLAVITQPDKPAGRGQKLTAPPIKILAQEHNLQVFQPKSIRKDTDLQATLKSLNPDFFVTLAFGQILSQDVLDIPKIWHRKRACLFTTGAERRQPGPMGHTPRQNPNRPHHHAHRTGCRQRPPSYANNLMTLTRTKQPKPS